MRCVHCGSTNFDEDRARADLICLDCGMVLSENAISSEVEFVETGNGLSTAVGRFVSDGSQQVGRESKQITENRARRRIDTICGQLRLGSDVSVSAFRFYQSALFRGLTRGRGAMHTAAGCIYLAARQLRVNLMLLDLSDAVGINVYVLGHCYAELKRKLHLAIPEMDPCLFIERFANQLEFGDKMSVVATTAMRLLQRMKKDWIATGRRPSGLAAAALLVAARIHEFNRTEEDVARVARISQQTTRKRLQEFGRTPTSKLSIDDFFAIDYEEEQDPPAFSASKKSEENVQEMDEEAFARITLEIKELERRIENQLRVLSEKRSSRTFADKLAHLDVGGSKGLHHLISDQDESLTGPPRSNVVGCGSTVSDESGQVSSSSSVCTTRNVLRDVLDGVVEPELLDNCVEDLQILTEHSGNAMCELLDKAEELRNLRELQADAKILDEKIATAATPSVSNEVDSGGTEQKTMKLPVFIPNAQASKIEYPSAEDGTLIVDDIDDEELDREYILHPREVMIKAAVWYKANAEYLQAVRRMFLVCETSLVLEMLFHASLAARQRRGRTPRKSESRGKFDPMDEDSEDKPLSSKINYEALEAIVGTSTSQQPITQTSTNPSSSLAPGPLLAATLLADGPGSNIPPTVLSPSTPVSIMKSDSSKAVHATPAVVHFAAKPEVREIPSCRLTKMGSTGGVDEDDPVDISADTTEIIDDEEVVVEDEEDDDAWEDGNDLW
ncbi:Transcription factor IIIB subunit [Fasciola gigantica]|uniref:B-related factor 1 n=1 Tax=Fasciola gigantica TaxID=46835 RepID=A0A504Z522_FASGI|nr:Transcription factor IIIB subunit [Fasciola gigantica]